MLEHNDEELEALAGEIAIYLRSHNRTADTIEGIAQWWILRLRLQEQSERVKMAVALLYERGLIEERVLPGGKVLYSAVKKKQ